MLFDFCPHPGSPAERDALVEYLMEHVQEYQLEGVVVPHKKWLFARAACLIIQKFGLFGLFGLFGFLGCL